MNVLFSYEKWQRTQQSVFFTDEAISSFSNEIDHWIETGEESPSFMYSVNSLAFPMSLRGQNWRGLTGDASSIVCIVCQSAVKTYMERRKKGMTEEEIRSSAIKFCTLLNIEDEEVCTGSITLNLVSVMLPPTYVETKIM